MQIRDETQTKIDLPAEGEKSDVITITGKKENVEDARDRIQKIQNELVSCISKYFVIWFYILNYENTSFLEKICEVDTILFELHGKSLSHTEW